MKEKFNNFDEFAKAVGIIENIEVLEKIKAPINHSSFEEGHWSADFESQKVLTEFVAKNPKYHIVTYTSDGDDYEGRAYVYDNRMRVVNRLSYYLADGNKDENIHCVEIEDG